MENVTKTNRTPAPPKYQAGQRVYFLFRGGKDRQEVVPGVVVSYVRNGQAYEYNIKTVAGLVPQTECDLFAECDHSRDDRLKSFEEDFAKLPTPAQQFLKEISMNYEVTFQKAGILTAIRVFLEAYRFEYTPYYVAQALDILKVQHR